MARLNPNLLKNAFPYTIEDLSRLYGVSDASIRRTIQKYPDAVIAGSPKIVVGRLLKNAMLTERPSKKRSMKVEATFFCAACKKQVGAAGQLVEAAPLSPGVTARLSALCEHCEGSVSRFVSLKDRAAFEVSLGEAVIGEWGD